MRYLRLWGLGLLILLSSISAPAVTVGQTEPVATDGIALPDRSVTTQSNAASVEVNPAGLGFLETVEARYNFELNRRRNPAELIDQHGFFVGAGSRLIAGGFGVQWLDRPVLGTGDSNPYQKYTLAGALRPFDRLSFGAGVHFYGTTGSQRLNELTSFDVGAQWRASRYLGFGVNIRDINHPFVTETTGLPARLQPGVALRLFDGRLVVDTEVDWRPGPGELALSPRLNIRPVEGLSIYGRASLPFDDAGYSDDAPTFVSAGLAFSMEHVGLKAASRFAVDGSGDQPGYRGQTQSVWYSAETRDSLVRPVGRWVQVDLTGGIGERASDSPLTGKRRSFLNLLTRLRAIGRDRNIDGVLFRIGGSGLGYAQAWELRRQIIELSEAGKTTVGFLSSPTFRDSYIASAADQTLLLPAEPYEPEGVRVSRNNYAEALSKIGVEAEFVRIGAYKSAPETYVRKTPSEPALEQTRAYVDALFDNVVEGIAEGRNIDRARVVEAIDNIPLLPDRAAEGGFVDRVAYEDEIRPYLRRQYGANQILRSNYDPTPGRRRGWAGGPEVAVVYVDGSIIRGQSTEAPLIGEILSGSKTLTRVLDRLARDRQTKAVVLRVDSPGGSAVASDLIYRAIRRLAQQKPVVASMGDVAASGGYYVAAGADTIYATPNTLTGSIGIYAGKFSIGDLAEVLGINRTTVERGDRSEPFDIFEPWTAEQRERVSRSIHYLYRMFLHQVAQTRPLSTNEIDEVARGHVWPGEAARNRKLVDRMGGLIEAIEYAEGQANLEPGSARLRSYPKPTSFLNLPFSDIGVFAQFYEAIDGSVAEAAGAGSILKHLFAGVDAAILRPLLYDQEEPLMLPPSPIGIDE